MAISTAFTRLPWTPAKSQERGSVLFRLAGSSCREGRADGMVAGPPGRFLLPVRSEGSRVGDGTALSDPYAYENDGVTLCDLRPLGVSGVETGLGAAGFVPSASAAGASTGNFVDDPNTGVASQAPRTPGKMMVLSGQPNGNDLGLLPGIEQPKSMLVIQKQMATISSFSPTLDLNGAVATGSGNSRADIFFFQAYRVTLRNGIGGTYLLQLSNVPTPGDWTAVLWRKEATGMNAYSATTGALLSTTDLGTGPSYVDDVAVAPGNAVHTLGGRRFNVSAGATADRLRQRDFSEVHVQEIVLVNELLNPKEVARWVNFNYPNLQNGAV